MDELRNIILAHLEELHNSGLSDARYDLYTEAVYKCASSEELLELAALELQLESHEFFMQLREQAGEDYHVNDDFDDIDRDNNDGFGGEDDEDDLGAMVALFDDDDDTDSTVVSNEANNESSDLFAFDPIASTIQGDQTTVYPSGFTSGFPSGFDSSVSHAQDSESDDEIDPRILAIQQAAMKKISGDDDEDIDIDALLSGGIPPQPTISSESGDYKDALAELLAAYPMSDEDDEVATEEQVEEDEPVTFDASDLLGIPPTGAFNPIPSGFPQSPEPVAAARTVKKAVKKPGLPQSPPVLSDNRQESAKKTAPQSDLKNIFSDFSKRKPKKPAGTK